MRTLGVAYIVKELEQGPVRPSPRDPAIMIRSVLLPVDAIEFKPKCTYDRAHLRWGRWNHLSDDERHRLMYGPILELSLSERKDRKMLLKIAYHHRRKAQPTPVPWASDVDERCIKPMPEPDFDLAFGPWQSTWTRIQQARRLHLRELARRRIRRFGKAVPFHIIVEGPDVGDKRTIDDPDMPPAKRQKLDEAAMAMPAVIIYE
jgi:hypothetical protein